MSEPFQKAPLMPETRSSATDQEMSQTTLNKGQHQMDSVLKSWGFRTSRDPFQQSSTQGLEANKGQKSTPLREVVCSGTSLEKEPPRVSPLGRDESSLNQRFAVPNGRHHIRGSVIHHSVRAHLCLRLGAGSEICRQLRSERKLLDPMVWSVLHLHAEPVGLSRRVQQTKGWTLVGSNKAPRRTTRFFDVLTAPVFQEKKP